MDDEGFQLTETQLKPNEFGPDTRDDFQVLKFDQNFAVFAETGCMNGGGSGVSELYCKDGLFISDTRVLSRFALSLFKSPLTAMGAGVSDDLVTFRTSLANTAFVDASGSEVPAYTIHIDRTRFLNEGLHDHFRIVNYMKRPVDLDLVIDCWADFRDIFEVRGVKRAERGRLLSPVAGEKSLTFAYETLDRKRVTTNVSFDRKINTIDSRVHLNFRLKPGESDEFGCVVSAKSPELPKSSRSIRTSHASQEIQHQRAVNELGARRNRLDLVRTSRPRFDIWLKRSAADLAMLTSSLDTGLYPFAGVPWFSAPFGRDAIITSLQTLWLDPTLAGGTLEYLAAHQATDYDRESEAAPGKILHEARQGEMARLGEVPFGLYYGGVDQTLLFVILVERYFRRTGNRDWLERFRPAVDAALEWAERDGDRDGDGFIEYLRSDSKGLRNQGWKDSDDAVFHADGTLAEGPIALVEVQAYYVAALRAAATISKVLGDDETAAKRNDKADALEKRLDAEFWDRELGSWVMALDGDKRPVRIVSSNAGHVLFAGAATPARAAKFARTLERPELSTNWGIRTVSSKSALFNPMGYHTGSIWPHDNSLIVAGLARYGYKAQAGRLVAALFEASVHFPGQRLPELYCGFSGEVNPRVIAYPSACSPQAWAAGVPFMCIESTLGLGIDVPGRRISLIDPQLPADLQSLKVTNLNVAGRRVDLQFVRGNDGVTHLEVLRSPEDLDFAFKITSVSE